MNPYDWFDRWMPGVLAILLTTLFIGVYDTLPPLLAFGWVLVILFGLVTQWQGIRRGWYEYPWLGGLQGGDP